MEFNLQPELEARFPGPQRFDQVLALEGTVLRELEGRRTLRFEVDGRGYYAKLHTGVGWHYILRHLLSLRIPVVGARDEFLAIRALEPLGVPTMRVVGYGCRGLNPARRQSFVLTEELTHMVNLEDLSREWKTTPPPPALKRTLIEQVSWIARTLHRNGLNHRDFYLCHFLLDETSITPPYSSAQLRVHLIDLHRMQRRSATPRRWVIKDLGGLFFSAMDSGLTRLDFLRFIRGYEGRPLPTLSRARLRFWQAVHRRATRLYCRIHKRPPILPDRLVG